MILKRVRCVWYGGAVLGVVHLLGFSAFAAGAGFVSLFDGETLAGWHQVNCAKETFTVRDGLIVCTGKPTGVLRSDKQYENFVFEAEWRHMKPKGNAGIFVWSEGISAPGVPFARSIEVQVLENEYGKSDWFTTHGDIFPIHGSTMEPDHPRKGSRSFPTEERSLPAGKWNKYVIVCLDGSVKLSVNGKFVNGGSQCNYRKGYFCLESEGSEVHFRNLRLYELPSSGADTSNTAPLVEGFVSRYSGVDLRGWSVDSEVKKVWKSDDWRLRCQPSPGDRRDLVMDGEFGDYSVQIDYKWEAKDADAALCPLLLGGRPVWPDEAMDDGLKTALKGLKPGKFVRLRVDRQGEVQTVSLNGRMVVKNQAVSRSRKEKIALRNAGVEATFSSIYILE